MEVEAIHKVGGEFDGIVGRSEFPVSGRLHRRHTPR
jgi:hypothetical protein